MGYLRAVLVTVQCRHAPIFPACPYPGHCYLVVSQFSRKILLPPLHIGATLCCRDARRSLHSLPHHHRNAARQRLPDLLGAPDPSRPQYVATAAGGRLRHARGGLLHRPVPRRPARSAGLGAEQSGHPGRLSAGAERRGRAQRAAVSRRLAGTAGRHGSDLGRRGLFGAEPGLDLCQRLSHRAGQRPDRLGAVALSGAETAAAVAHRGGRDRPARAALPGPQLHPALVGGQGWPGRADAGQQYHHVRRRAVFHRAAHDAARWCAKRRMASCCGNRRPTT